MAVVRELGFSFEVATRDIGSTAAEIWMVEPLKITVEIDDMLIQTASRLLGTDDHTAVVNAALKLLVERESARRLARLGGSEPYIRSTPRRRTQEGPPTS